MDKNIFYKMNQDLDNLIKISEEFALKEVIIKTNSEQWLESNKGLIINGNIVKLLGENLRIDINIDKQIYLSYNEKNIKFKSKPNNNLKFFPGKSYQLDFNAKVYGKLNAQLFFIGYDEDKKVMEEIVPANQSKIIEIDTRCNGFRLAIRFKGKGIFELNTIKFSPIKEERKSEKFISSLSNTVNKKIDTLEDVEIACILDEFSYESFSKTCNMITFTPENFIEVLSNKTPTFLLVESAWKGYKGTWEYKIAKYNNQDKTPLIDLINYCKSRNIPTVFWNKEDPIHFERFIDTAKLFDYIFTTDRNIINNYKQVTGNEKVYALPFAAQPYMHNPISKYKRKEGICFAGSYYGNRHADRKKDMDEVLSICKNYNLTIFDRNYESTLNNPNSPFRYPAEYKENIKGSLKYTEIDKAYKGYDVMLNVNSVKNSPTMFSRRVFEGLACGTPIISTYSKGINELFGDIIMSDDDSNKLSEKVNRLMNDKEYWKELSLKGIRRIMYNHTYSDRLIYVLSKMNINIEKKLPKVSVVCLANSEKDIKDNIKIFNNMEYPDKDLIILCVELFDGYIECINRYNNNNIYLYIEEYVSKNYRLLNELTKSDFIAFIDSNNYYGENYLIDLIAATKYTDVDIIGRCSYYYFNNKKQINLKNKDEEYVFVDSLLIDRAMIKVSSFNSSGCDEIIRAFKEKSNMKKYFREGKKIFSIDNNNFIQNGNINILNDKVISEVVK